MLPLLPVFLSLSLSNTLVPSPPPALSPSLPIQIVLASFMAPTGRFLIKALEGGREAEKMRSKRGKGEGRGEKRGLGEQRGFSAAAFVLLAQWPSVNATHRASLLERMRLSV